MTAKPVSRLVDGAWRAPDGDRVTEVRNPADLRQVVARVPAMNAAEVS